MKSWLIVLAASVLLFGEAAAQVPGTRSSEVVSMAGTDYYLHRVAPGETVYSLSRLYGVAEERFYEDNPAVKEAGLKAGETVMYNQWGLNILLTEKGIFLDAKGQNVEVNNATNVTINASQGILANTPILRCTGDIVDNCETNTRTLKELRDAHNDHDHVVKNAQSGNDNIRSQKTEDQVT